MMRLEVLGRPYFAEVYRLMVVRGFPAVPPIFAEALPYFRRVQLIGGLDKDRLAVVFVLGKPQDGIAFLDVVCAADYVGVWAKREVILALKHLLFGVQGVRALWVQTHSKKALKTALSMGFTPVTDLRGEAPILVMTRLMAGFENIKIKTERLNDGFVIQNTNASTGAASAAGDRAR